MANDLPFAERGKTGGKIRTPSEFLLLRRDGLHERRWMRLGVWRRGLAVGVAGKVVGVIVVGVVVEVVKMAWFVEMVVWLALWLRWLL